MRKALPLLLVFLLFACASLPGLASSELNHQRQAIMNQIDQYFVDFRNAMASVPSIEEKSFQYEIDAAIDYARQSLANEEQASRVMREYAEKRRNILASLPELSSYLSQMESVNRDIEGYISEDITIHQRQLDITYQLKSAWQAQDANRWNGLVDEKNRLLARNEEMKAQGKSLLNRTESLLNEARAALASAIAATPTQPPAVRLTTGAFTATAQKLAKLGKYKKQNGQTQCSLFVRDFAQALLGESLPELSGRASQQIARLEKLSGQQGTGWSSVPFNGDNKTKEAALLRAQEAANEGKLVIVVWKNPKPTATNSGHVAVLMPGQEKDWAASGSWGEKHGKNVNPMKVPFVAQAGETTDSHVPLNYAFRVFQKNALEIFVFDQGGRKSSP